MTTKQLSAPVARRVGLLSAAVAITVVSLVVAGHASAQSAGAGAPAPQPAGSNSPSDPKASGRQAVDPEAAKAFARTKGISVLEATKRLLEQSGLGERAASIEKSLAGRSGGSYINDKGQLVITTMDEFGDNAAVRSGARVQRVDNSTEQLDNLKGRLDKLAAVVGTGGVQGWYVDVPSNTLVVTVTKGATDARTRAITKLANSFGDSARIEYTSAEQAPNAAEYLVAGTQYVLPNGGTCSVGFNTRDAAGRNVVLTAGHCVKSDGVLTRNGYQIGAPRTADFPGDDFGTFWNANPNYWQPSTSVATHRGSYITVRGVWNTPPVGATVCKSGRTTGYTCGTITALNQTVTYKDGSVLYGLVRHNACVEPGDSGGANISAGAFALGVTSGAATRNDLCLSKFGEANVSFYQPIGEALSRNGLTLLS